MDYHKKQLLLQCIVCGQRLVMRKHKNECKAFPADLYIAFIINPLTDNAPVHLNIFTTAATIKCRGLSVPGQEECTTDVH